MKILKRLPLLVFASTLLFVAGCVTETVDPRVTVEPQIAGQFSVGPVFTRIVKGHIVEARTVLHNQSTLHTRKLEYRVNWTDVQGFAIKSTADAWMPFTLLPSGEHTISFVGPTPDAYEFNVYIRKTNR